jgi:signal transduction histidine kinase
MTAASGGRVTADDLRRIRVLADLPEEELAWIASRSEMVDLEPGDLLFDAGEPAAWMHMSVEGTVHARRAGAPPDSPPWIILPGELSGMIPFSRMTEFPAAGRAVTHARIARFPASGFQELLARAPALESRLVGVLADRVREVTWLDQQQEKLAALGKLSAGLAHEMKNPAVAARRAAAELRRRLESLDELTVALCASGTPIEALREVRRRATAHAGPSGADPLQRADQEEELTAWLASNAAREPSACAATFVDAGLTAGELARVVADVPREARATALAWMEAAVAVDVLVGAIENASERIAELAGAVKAYARSDRGAGKGVDVRAGLESTLAMLAHRIREKRIALAREYDPDLPAIPGQAGELNQVWTNLIDNAVDALPAGGRLVVRAARDGDAVRVEVCDDGPGIPRPLLDRVWEPFFTTKGVGEGAGLGLDIARRIVTRHHGGEIRVSSVPGDTRFSVRLPIAGVGRAEGAGAGPHDVASASARTPTTGAGGGHD